MSTIHRPTTLTDYYEEEKRLDVDSKKRWNEEHQLFSDLSDLFEQLCLIVSIPKVIVQTCSDLFLATHCQMMGVVSLLLKRRLNDAQTLTRRAIEATATAH